MSSIRHARSPSASRKEEAVPKGVGDMPTRRVGNTTKQPPLLVSPPHREFLLSSSLDPQGVSSLSSLQPEGVSSLWCLDPDESFFSIEEVGGAAWRGGVDGVVDPRDFA